MQPYLLLKWWFVMSTIRAVKSSFFSQFDVRLATTWNRKRASQTTIYHNQSANRCQDETTTSSSEWHKRAINWSSIKTQPSQYWWTHGQISSWLRQKKYYGPISQVTWWGTADEKYSQCIFHWVIWCGFSLKTNILFYVISHIYHVAAPHCPAFALSQL